MLLEGFSSVIGLIMLVVLAMAVFALVDAAMRRQDAYPAANKQNKQFWMIILGVTVLVNLLLPMLFLQIIGLIATIVYIVDVRPALKEVMGGGGGRQRGGSSSDGPYGPYNGGR
ncbi:DUF2516 family protein [Streptomyces oceani]|uniref:DUF2516 domain-containing protein n=1 Tax=Streptomyces oceani TaxID=1075402 RepID=A0A1E7KQC6_9ACTN|nr:DUF2516 family protein [Streptomyces oceani]OEV06053.1 hypothetical protein AN216_00595 [Streptomyces oceani]